MKTNGSINHAQGAQRTRKTNSIQFKMVFMITAAIVATVLLFSLLIFPRMNRSVKKINTDYLYDLSVSYGLQLENLINDNGKKVLSDPDSLAAVVKNVKLKDASTSYCYVVSFDGTMLYHPIADKIGEPVENAAVTQVVKEIKSGRIPKPAVVTYQFRGVTKCAAYYVGKDGFILVVSADQDDFLSVVSDLQFRGLFAGIIIYILGMIIAILIANHLTKPLVDVTDIINRFSTLDFSEDPRLNQLVTRTDESGEIARSVFQMRHSLTDIVLKIQEQSSRLYKASSLLDHSASVTTTNVGSVRSAVNEIATGASSQASETQKATEDIVIMGNMIEKTHSEVQSLDSTAQLMRDSSEIASSTLQSLDEINQKAIHSIQTIYEQTNVTNASALKIKDAASLIASIAEETNLLSLNASIEAARAGEAGRGFAVVASQIQKLAEQSNDSAQKIDDIIHTLIQDSETAVSTMKDVHDIMQEQNINVEKTGAVFSQLKDGIRDSIHNVNEISDKAVQLDHARSNIVDTVQSLSAIAEENAASTEETSSSVIEIGEVIEDLSDSTKELKKIATVLENSIHEFKLS